MLNDTRVRTTKACERPIKLSDSGGLYLLIQPHGSKLWRLAYRFGGKQKTLVSTPQQKCIGWPEQKYINDAGEQGPELGAFVRHQTWAGLSAGVSELARRERLLL